MLNLANAVTSFGDAVNKAKAGKAGSSGGALNKVGRVVLYAELVNFALDNLNPEAAKNPNLHQSGIGTETNFNPEYKGDSSKPIVLSLTGLMVQLIKLLTSKNR